VLLRIFEVLLDFGEHAWSAAGIGSAGFNPGLEVGDLGFGEFFLRRHLEVLVRPFNGF